VNTLYCPFLYNRCEITIDKNRFAEADAIIYHMRDGIDRNLVKEKRHSKQRIVFTLWESPAHTENAAAYREFFNWTMTYRFDSHIITSYYSGNPFIHTSSEFYRLMVHENATKKLNFTTKKSDHRPSDEVLKKKTMGTAAAIVSNCGGSSGRLAFINKLKQYTDVKIYGRCGERCPPNRDCRQFVAENYYYILSFENSLCTQYAS
jgi:alpha-1,3-fucosyltransferase